MNIQKSCIIIFIIILFAAISCKKNFQIEKEPNNDFQTANKIEPDMIIKGLLDSPSDHDFYRLYIVSPVVTDIELTSVKGVNHAIKIWKEKSGENIILKYIDDARKSSPERMRNMFFDAGIYYMEILHGDKDNPQGNTENQYELRLSQSKGDEEERESNDTYENANPIEIGKEIKGYFSPSFNKLNQNAVDPFREEDWYQLNISLPDENPILLDINLSGVPDVNSILSILDSDINEIASSDSAGTGEGERLEGIGVRKSGTYYIMVASHFESNPYIPYGLKVSSRTYDFSTEIEPNNNFGTANLIVKEEITGRIFPEGDKDYYYFDAHSSNKDNEQTQRNQYKIEASSEGLDLILKIFDENMKKLFETDNLKSPGREIIPNAFIKNNFYVEISSRRGAITGTEYKLKLSSFPYSENYEIEPNDTKEKACRVKTNKIIGFVSKKDDKDFYLLEYKNRVKRKIIFNSIKNSELKISITDPLGFIIKTESAKNGETVSFSEMIDSKAYLIVESVVENYDEPYSIELGE